MTVFLTPELAPFFGGTYFPPDDRHGRPSFMRLIELLDKAWRERRGEVEQSGKQVLAELTRVSQETAPGEVGEQVLDDGVRIFERAYDAKHAGFGSAPKFPRPCVLDFLLDAHARTGHAPAAAMVVDTLRAMSRGGMYDQLGGGFHRYSVDREWHVPHFEKMLYDQGQLVRVLAAAWQLTGDVTLRERTRETCGYVLRDLLDPATGAFYAAEDADSLPDGETKAKKEGAFFVWHDAALRKLAGEDAALAAARWGILPHGNAHDPHGELTGMNVLHVLEDEAALAKRFSTTVDDVARRLERVRAVLFEVRERRARPHRDEKILAGWNGLMIGALARAAVALPEPAYVAAATRAATAVRDRLIDGETMTLRRRLAGGEAGLPAVIEDYAFVAAGLVDLYEAGFDHTWLALAERLTERLLSLFDDGAGGFYATSGRDPSVRVRMREDYDGAEPAGGSIAAQVLARLAILCGKPEWTTRAEAAVHAVGKRLAEQPHALPALLVARSWTLTPPAEVVIVGERGAADTEALLAAVHAGFQPRKVVRLLDGGHAPPKSLPHLASMTRVGGKATAYVCRSFACERPTTDPAEIPALLGVRRV